MRVKNLFGEYEELNVGKPKSRIVVNKVDRTEEKIPRNVLQKIYARPEKKYYAIGEVAKLFEVKTSLLRYWEEKFSQIRPSRGSNGARRYTKKDIETINTIHYYLKVKKWTIIGLRDHLQREPSESKSELRIRLENIKKKLLEINKNLESIKQV